MFLDDSLPLLSSITFVSSKVYIFTLGGSEELALKISIKTAVKHDYDFNDQ
jgi:hypothetical protein